VIVRGLPVSLQVSGSPPRAPARKVAWPPGTLPDTQDVAAMPDANGSTILANEMIRCSRSR
jgi:hypothetical protein